MKNIFTFSRLKHVALIGEYRRTCDNPGYLKFLDWLEASAPYESHHIKPLSASPYRTLIN